LPWISGCDVSFAGGARRQRDLRLAVLVELDRRQPGLGLDRVPAARLSTLRPTSTSIDEHQRVRRADPGRRDARRAVAVLRRDRDEHPEPTVVPVSPDTRPFMTCCGSSVNEAFWPSAVGGVELLAVGAVEPT
jgi:hypothetical protein